MFSESPYTITHVVETDHDWNIVAKSLHVLSSRTYHSTPHVSVEVLRDRFIVHVLNTCPFIGESKIGVVGPIMSIIIVLPVLAELPARSRAYHV